MYVSADPDPKHTRAASVVPNVWAVRTGPQAPWCKVCIRAQAHAQACRDTSACMHVHVNTGMLHSHGGKGIRS